MGNSITGGFCETFKDVFRVFYCLFIEEGKDRIIKSNYKICDQLKIAAIIFHSVLSFTYLLLFTFYFSIPFFSAQWNI